ncbi:DUF885 family protein [uncultured Chitinophaga sp.]|uniref:DUF885 family protein n=1 Tax=uncultured Chitinophaga sp. TaxID=339340 RepID=UPI0025E99E85|nr:DUF885 family protein [uncultured Chitinophaga sp.]
MSVHSMPGQMTAQDKGVTALYQQTSEVNNIMVKYSADRGNLMRFYSIDNSPERRERFRIMYQGYLDQIEKMDFESLPVGSRVDYLLFRQQLQDQLRKLDIEKKEVGQLKDWFTFADKIYETEKLRRRGTELEAQPLAASWHSIAQTINKNIKALETSGGMDIYVIRRGGSVVRGLKEAVQSINEFYKGYDPSYTWWMAGPAKELNDALDAYSAAWRTKEKAAPSGKDDGSGIIGYPIGNEELIRQLQIEMIPYTPEELVAIANKEFAYCDAEMLKASREMGFGDNWKAAMEKVKNTYVAPGKQPQMIMRLYNESVDFLKKHDLITIPPMAEEAWSMIMMTPERQLVNPFFTGGETLSISYPTNDMSEADKLMSMRGNNPHFSRSTVHHELIAGHHLQGYMESRYKTYRNFQTPFWIEGWALYWEMLLWDMKFPQSPEDRIGMLFWRMHRCARIIFSLNYHTNKWTPQQCIDFLVDRVGHERANAEGEVRRSFVGGYSPLYQIAYMIGGLQFYALQRELVPAKMTMKQYHDAVLQENGMPVEMVRAILTSQPLKKEFKTNWRFYQVK